MGLGKLWALMNSFGVFCLKVLVVLMALQVIGILAILVYVKIGDFFEFCRDSSRRAYWWVLHRTTKRFHIVRIRTLRPGYWDTDTRILHAVMGLVVDHVEISISAAALCRSTEKVTFKEWLWLVLPQGFSSSEWIRSRSRGLEHLSWEKKLDCLSIPLEERSPQQAQAARVIEEVYLWWKDVYPNRKSGEDLVNWKEHVEKRRLWGGEGGYFDVSRIPQFILDEEKAALDKAIQIEQEYLDEEKKMLKKIVDILPHIWI